MILGVLSVASRYGRAWLVGGLIAGLTLPGLASAVRPWIPELVVLLIFTAAFRIGPLAAWGGRAVLRSALAQVVILQFALPLFALVVLSAAGISGAPLAVAIILMLAAPSISGSPNLAILVGYDPAPALRLTILGTALFPLTVLPVLASTPALDGADVAVAALRLLLTIGLAAGAAFGLRQLAAPALDARWQSALDGIGAILMAVAVVGLMAGLAPALRTSPGAAALWVGAAFAINLGLQVAVFLAARRSAAAVPTAIVAGNRNVALFLVALPSAVTDPILAFIGAYQLPMYLTPILMRPIYRLARGSVANRQED